MSWLRTIADWLRGHRHSWNEKEIDDSHMNDSEGRILLVGLGNPGREHRGNRHNVGFMLIDRFASRYGIALGRVQNKAIIGDGRVGERPVILAKPQTYMNHSGDAVGPLARYYRIPAQSVLVAYDDIDLAPGMIRLRQKGGSGGHNGMKSIIQHLGEDFPRLRLGIGRPSGKMPPAAYVLQDFGNDEEPLLDAMLDEALDAVETYLRDGIDLAMSRHNGPVMDDTVER
ncbi:MAG TPA: aminoacyl-tRNA hydrolase [Candidatus Binatia bacterium]|nr:aminoacyl-tRNA hydrolase [Candidatus Binatia bacterium]